jgi:hypothetical protein
MSDMNIKAPCAVLRSELDRELPTASATAQGTASVIESIADKPDPHRTAVRSLMLFGEEDVSSDDESAKAGNRLEGTVVAAKQKAQPLSVPRIELSMSVVAKPNDVRDDDHVMGGNPLIKTIRVGSSEIINIELQEKYEWQSEVLRRLSDKKFMFVIIQSECGSGKTIVPIRMIETDANSFNGTEVMVPSNRSDLIQQHMDKLEDEIAKNPKIRKSGEPKKTLNNLGIITKISFNLSIDGRTADYKFIIRTFEGKLKSKARFLDRLPSNHRYYIDEFHEITTGLGIRHPSVHQHHSGTHIKSFGKAIELEGYTNVCSLIKKFRENNLSVVGLSATMHDFIINELPYYQNVTPFRIFNVAPIRQGHKVSMMNSNSAMDEAIKWGSPDASSIKKVLIYSSTTAKSQAEEEKFKKANEQKYPGCAFSSYRCDSKNTGSKILDKNRIIRTSFNFLVGKGTTGLDLYHELLILINRKLSDKSSSALSLQQIKDVYCAGDINKILPSENIRKISNMAAQMFGRCRNIKSKRIWIDNAIHDDDDPIVLDLDFMNDILYNIISKSETLNYYKRVRELQDIKTYENDIYNNHFRPFIFSYLYWKKYNNNYSKPGLLDGLKKLVNDFIEQNGYPMEESKWEKMLDQGDEQGSYLELEKNACALCAKYYKLEDAERKYTNSKSDTRNSGGNKQKSNISATDRAKMQRVMEDSIREAGFNEKSPFTRGSGDANWSESTMHAKDRSQLSHDELKNPKYAIPIIDCSLNLGLNSVDGTDNIILCYDNGIKLTSYDNLLNSCSISPETKQLIFRREDEINKIFTIYNRRMT